MNFEGSLVVERAPDKVWDFLWDVEKLARCIPGCQRLVTLKEREKYQVTLSDHVGPIRLNFDAYVDVKAVDPGKAIRVSLQGKDLKAGGMMQTMEISLEGLAGSKTKVDFKTAVSVFGKLGTLGYPFIKKKASAVIEEFSQKVKSEIEAS